MTNNLPDDVTPGDIDKHFGGPAVTEKRVSLTVSVDVLARGTADDLLRSDAREQVVEAFDESMNTAQILGMTIEEVEPVT